MPKDSARITAMRMGGKKLAAIKNHLAELAQTQSSLTELDHEAERLIKKTGGQPSFKTVPNYHWCTCININDGIVHGIPKGTIKQGDLVTIDIGLLYKGYHTDTATSFVVGTPSSQQNKFLSTGRAVLAQAINQAIPGNKIIDISRTIQTGIESAGYNVIRELTGHGVGEELHQPPSIPCFVSNSPDRRVKLKPGMTIAIEVMYAMGDWPLVLAEDEWTLSTRDGQPSAVFEETVLVTKTEPEILTLHLEKSSSI